MRWRLKSLERNILLRRHQAHSATLVFSDSSLSFAVSRLLGGVAFSLGLILVVVAGAELFTGNNFLVITTSFTGARSDKTPRTGEVDALCHQGLGDAQAGAAAAGGTGAKRRFPLRGPQARNSSATRWRLSRPLSKVRWRSGRG